MGDSKDKKKKQGNQAAKNKLIDLNNHLFAQMERISDLKLSKEALSQEIIRSKAVSGLASQIIGNARLALDAALAVKKIGEKNISPMLLGVGGNNEDSK